MFGQHLVSKGLITEKQLFIALEQQQQSCVSIGRLAFQEQILELDQIIEILERQEGSQMLFGELAVVLGMFTPEQRDHLVAIQKESTPPLGQVLAELGMLDVEVLEGELEAYLSGAAEDREE